MDSGVNHCFFPPKKMWELHRTGSPDPPPRWIFLHRREKQFPSSSRISQRAVRVAADPSTCNSRACLINTLPKPTQAKEAKYPVTPTYLRCSLSSYLPPSNTGER